ncbi:MAG: hypothetical protein ACKOUT_11870 [Novosphingobium sp.]
MKKIHALILAGTLIGLVPAHAIAAPGQVTLQSEVKLEKTVVENGKPRQVLIEPKTVLPGERLLFTTRYANNGATPATNFVVTNAVPGPVKVAPESAANLVVSVDGGKSWGKLASLKVADGKGAVRGAQASDITHLRWTIPVIAPASGGKVEYEGIVR